MFVVSRDYVILCQSGHLRLKISREYNFCNGKIIVFKINASSCRLDKVYIYSTVFSMNACLLTWKSGRGTIIIVILGHSYFQISYLNISCNGIRLNSAITKQ